MEDLWVDNTKLNAFVSMYHVPYHGKYRFWTGLLLLVRVVLYIAASLTVSVNPQSIPLITIILVGGLVFLKGVIGIRIYKNLFVDIVNTVVYFNLLILAALSLYDFGRDAKKQMAVAHVSTLITLILFVGAIIYHVALLVYRKKSKNVDHNTSEQHDDEDGAAVTKPHVTHTVINLLYSEYHKQED